MGNKYKRLNWTILKLSHVVGDFSGPREFFSLFFFSFLSLKKPRFSRWRSVMDFLFFCCCVVGGLSFRSNVLLKFKEMAQKGNGN